MRRNHPRLDRDAIREFVDSVVSKSPDDSAVSGFLLHKDVDETGWTNKSLQRAVEALLKDCGPIRNSDLEPVEALHSGPVYEAINEFDDEALGDEAFWSYLAVRYFWRFISYRQEAAWLAAQGEPSNPDMPDSEREKLERYLIGKDHYQLPLRMYLRAQAVGAEGDYSLTDIDGGGTDFWRSQVLAVRTSWYPPLARSVVRAQRRTQLNVEEQRPSGSRVNRHRANYEFVLHDDDEAAAAIDGLWALTLKDELELAEKKSKKKATKTAAKKTPTKKAAAPGPAEAQQPTKTARPRSSKKAAV
jgi:hypothetical protein